MSAVENLKKSAKRWLSALRDGDPDAHARLRRAYPEAPDHPVLRDVQHALAREHGHERWADLLRALDTARDAALIPDIDQYEHLAKDFLAAYHSGDAAAMQRLRERLRRPMTWQTLRAEVDRELRHLPQTGRPRGVVTLAHVRHVIARSVGFENWASFVDALRVDDTPAAPGERVAVTVPPNPGSSGMLQPVELRVMLPIALRNSAYATTTDVWHMLAATHAGDLDRVRSLVAAIPGLVRCEYNYMPPLHLAVREGHVDLVRYLLEQGAFDPDHVTYPYKETLVTMAEDREHGEIARLLRESAVRARPTRAAADAVEGAGRIRFPADEARSRLQKLAGANALGAVAKLLERRPELARDELACWAEGILSLPANRGHRHMLELLMAHGARVPDVAKWGRAYYFKHCDIASLLLDRGMNPNHMNWHRTTLLHDMAWEGDVGKARLLLDHGADIDAIDDEFRSTPLGIAARWGRRDIVRLFLDDGADPNRAGAPWAAPLQWAVRKGHVEIAADLRSAGAR